MIHKNGFDAVHALSFRKLNLVGDTCVRADQADVGQSDQANEATKEAASRMSPEERKRIQVRICSGDPEELIFHIRDRREILRSEFFIQAENGRSVNFSYMRKLLGVSFHTCVRGNQIRRSARLE